MSPVETEYYDLVSLFACHYQSFPGVVKVPFRYDPKLCPDMFELVEATGRARDISYLGNYPSNLWRAVVLFWHGSVVWIFGTKIQSKDMSVR